MRTMLKLPFAMDILILAAWGIGIVRNNKLFKNQNATLVTLILTEWLCLALNQVNQLNSSTQVKLCNTLVCTM
jgi:hypothetical protein